MMRDNVSTMDQMSMLSMMMLDDHGAVCCMIMFGVCYGWLMLSKMMLDDHDAVCCFLILVDWVRWSMLSYVDSDAT